MKFRESQIFCIITAAIALTFLTVGNPRMFGQSDSVSRDKVELSLSSTGIHNAEVHDLGSKTYQITATGTEPTVDVVIDGSIAPGRNNILAFDYFSASGTSHVQVQYGASGAVLHNYEAPGLSHSEGFTKYSANLAAASNWNLGVRVLRLGFELKPGQKIQIRNLSLRAPTQEEEQAAGRRVEEHAYDARLNKDLQAYLAKTYPAAITSVYVSKRLVRIEGDTGNVAGDIYLAEVPLYEDITELKHFDYVIPVQVESGHFQVNLTRFRNLPDHRYDRVFSQWVLARKNDTGYELLSHARYADGIVSQWNLPDAIPATKKGLGGVAIGRAPMSDLGDLGITSITVNVYLGFLRSSAAADRIAFDYHGKTYYADKKAISGYDKVLQCAAQRNILAAAIILVPPARDIPDSKFAATLPYPDADPSGIYVMPNVESAEGLETYAAALNFLAERYSRPDKKYGRIQDWILHNEVDAGWVWTNAGDKSELTYLYLYQKSMRTMYYIARQYNPHAKVFISLTHYWNWTDDKHFYLPRHLLNDLVQFSHAEGDFEWAIAQHPYPQSLFNPRTWEDSKVNDTFDTPLITFKNIEVLDAWTKQPRTYYRGFKQRAVFLSEQGFNSPDYSQKELREQAAALAYAWKKIQPLDSIQAMQYHNWVDGRGEGGLRIGLRKFPDDPIDPGGKKPIWYLYQKLGTLDENQACAFAKPILGIQNWKQILTPASIPENQTSYYPRDLYSDTWAATDALGRSLPTYAEVELPKAGRFVGMFYFLTFNSPGKPGPMNVTNKLKIDPNTANWKPGTYYWGEPEFGYYLSDDPWVIRRHAELLADAGVDVIIFDNTNGMTFPNNYLAIAKVYTRMRSEGERTPQIAFLASENSVDQLWNDFYSKGLYKDLWFQWKGKPLLMVGQQIGMQRIDQFPMEIQNFFTIRESWAWNSLPWYRDGHDEWPWIAHYPQPYGWDLTPLEHEAVPVGVAEHPLSAIGRSFHDGHEPATDQYDVTPYTAQGLFFQEQWNRALAVDPEFVFVTGWNEWSAGSKRMGPDIAKELASWDFFPRAKLSRAGHPLKAGDVYFIDEYNEEFSRDIEPMKGGHTDDYYYQLITNIRRYKGVHQPQPPSVSKTIYLNRGFSQWDDVGPEFRDHVYDTIPRDSAGNYKSGPYRDHTGRNDLVTMKVARDNDNIYFYARTREPLTSWKGPFWMLLFIDSDQSNKTGWEGYDYLVNARVLNSKTTTVEKSIGAGRWGNPVKAPMRVEGNELMIAIPRSIIGQPKGGVSFDFHWADNIQKLGDIEEFSLHGDSAPDRRSNYRYVADDK
jgi:hypothetical protein